MNIMQSDYFAEVAKQLNFTKAAKKLYITQPALSRHISMLEEELGVILLERNQRTVKLTDAGKTFLEEWEKIQLEIENMIGKVQYVGGRHIGEIRIGCLSKLNINDILKKHIDDFTNKFPECTVYIYRYNYDDLQKKLSSGELDLIITYFHELKSLTNILNKVICLSKGHIAVAKNHYLAGRDSLDFIDLKNIPFIMVNENFAPAISKQFYNIWEKNNYIPNTILRVPNIDTLISNVELGLGVTFLDDCIIENNNCTIKLYEIPNEDFMFKIVSAWKKENTNATLSLFLYMISNEI